MWDVGVCACWCTLFGVRILAKCIGGNLKHNGQPIRDPHQPRTLYLPPSLFGYFSLLLLVVGNNGDDLIRFYLGANYPSDSVSNLFRRQSIFRC